jgi:hypothetical protein
MAFSLEGLRNKSDEELVMLHDKTASDYQMTIGYFMDELNRREQNKMSKTMLRYIWWVTLMTFIMTICTIILLFK